MEEGGAAAPVPSAEVLAALEAEREEYVMADAQSCADAAPPSHWSSDTLKVESLEHDGGGAGSSNYAAFAAYQRDRAAAHGGDADA